MSSKKYQQENPLTAFFTNIKNTIGAWLADAGNGIASIFAKEIETKSLCVSDDSGAKTCITKSQLDALLASPTITTPAPPQQATPEDGHYINTRV